MSKTYEKAPDEVLERTGALIAKYHPDLDACDVRIDILIACNPDGTAVTHHGYPALALCRILSLKDRAKRMGDAEIVIDWDAYDGMSDEQKDGLIDHELEHIVVLRDKTGDIVLDDMMRPKLKLKKHDWQMGWFTKIAERHGRNSPEVYQAKILWDNDGQAFFPMLVENTSDAGGGPLEKEVKQLSAGSRKRGARIVVATGEVFSES